MLLRDNAEFDLAERLRQERATIGEVYAFISGLYFRGKVVYASAFAAAPTGVPPAVIIVPGIGLVPQDAKIGIKQLRAISQVPIHEHNDAYLKPLIRDASLLDRQGGIDCSYVLLGSIATEKYTRPLLEIFRERLLFPESFVGRGDMSRGGLSSAPPGHRPSSITSPSKTQLGTARVPRGWRNGGGNNLRRCSRMRQGELFL